MTDNTTLPGTGDVVRDIDRSGIKTQVIQLDFGGTGAESLATLNNPLPIGQSTTNFYLSSNNSSTAQLAAGATFIGVIETVQNQVAISLLVNSDQNMSITINQYIDLAGVYKISTQTYYLTAGVGFNRSFILNGNYHNLVITNQGFATTTTLNINTYYGTIQTTTQLGNQPIAIVEVPVGGVPVAIANVVSTADQNLIAARSADGPIYTAITGDSDGDFAGLNLIEQVINDNSGIGFNTKVTNLKTDQMGALIPTDMKGPFVGIATSTTNQWSPVIDTSGYSSWSALFSSGIGTGAVQVSQDGIIWQTPFFFSQAQVSWGPTQSASFTSTGIHLYGPCVFRYLRMILTSYSSGQAQCTVYLRTTPIPGTASQTIQTVLGLLVNGSVGEGSGAPNPVGVGGKIVTAAAAALTAGQIYGHTMSSARQLIIKPYSFAEADWQNTLALTTTTSTALVAAGAAGIRNYCTGISYQNSSVTASTINLLDGVTVVWQGNAPASMTVPAMVTFPTPLKGTAATAFNVQLGTGVTSVFTNAQGYQSA